jgi:hypothetical protein
MSRPGWQCLLQMTQVGLERGTEIRFLHLCPQTSSCFLTCGIKYKRDVK